MLYNVNPPRLIRATFHRGLLLVTFNVVFLLHGTIAKVYTCKSPFNTPMLTSNERITVVNVSRIKHNGL